MFSIGSLGSIFRSAILTRASPVSHRLPSLLEPLGQSGNELQISRSLVTCRVINTAQCQKSNSTLPALTSLIGSITPSWNPIRTLMRIHFPRPRENKRIKNHGWKTRMATPAQRRIIMKRILKGKHSLSHDLY